MLGLLSPWAAGAILAHEGTAISVQGAVRANGPIEIEGEDFEPGDVVRIELRKDGVAPVELGRVPVEADGTFITTLHLGADVQPGLYELAADGQESASFDLTVLAAAEGSSGASETQPQESVSNDRPAGETVGLVLFTVVLAAAAAGLLWLSRTKAHTLAGKGSA
jgi:hypothetical protein